MAGGGTTTVDNNNPYSNALATNAGAMWKLLEPMVKAGMEGRTTPLGETTAGTQEQISRHYAGRFGQPTGTEQFNRGLQTNYEDLTKPNMDWMKAAGGLYSAAGTPGPGGTTSTTQTDLGALDYAQLAMLIAAMVR